MNVEPHAKRETGAPASAPSDRISRKSQKHPMHREKPALRTSMIAAPIAVASGGRTAGGTPALPLERPAVPHRKRAAACAAPEMNVAPHAKRGSAPWTADIPVRVTRCLDEEMRSRMPAVQDLDVGAHA